MTLLKYNYLLGHFIKFKQFQKINHLKQTFTDTIQSM